MTTTNDPFNGTPNDPFNIPSTKWPTRSPFVRFTHSPPPYPRPQPLSPGPRDPFVRSSHARAERPRTNERPQRKEQNMLTTILLFAAVILDQLLDNEIKHPRRHR